MTLRRLSLCVFVSASLVASVGAQAFGWGVFGHRIIAHIAELHLSPKARAGIRKLLGTSDRISDRSVAAWADVIRPQRKETSPWHFVDIPYDATSYRASRDCTKGCVVEAIESARATLADATIGERRRIEALKFLVHLVGDAHQPLHCADRNHDRGGNDRQVQFLRRRTNLHSLWDTGLLTEMMAGMEVLEYAEKIDREITAQQATSWKRGQAKDWAEESHEFAVVYAYEGVPESGPPPVLDEDYLAGTEDAVKEQLQKAGIRLAMVLDKVFE